MLATQEVRSATTIGPVGRRAPGAGAATLVLLAGPRRGQAFELVADEALIGRGDGCAVPLDSESASKRHAAIRRTGARFTVEDLGSRNGTRVRGADLSPGQAHPLRHGDTVEAGDEILLFCDGSGQAPRQDLGHLCFDAVKVQGEVDRLLAGIDLTPRRGDGRSVRPGAHR